MGHFLPILNPRKPTTFKNIPVRLITENTDICAPYIRNIYNNSLKSNFFPNNLKMADIIPGYKKDDKTNKENYSPISILPSVSKIFERIVYNQTYTQTSKYIPLFMWIQTWLLYTILSTFYD